MAQLIMEYAKISDVVNAGYQRMECRSVERGRRISCRFEGDRTIPVLR
jgi:hypothetical protein